MGAFLYVSTCVSMMYVSNCVSMMYVLEICHVAM